MSPVGKDKADLLPGTLDLLVLKTVETMSPIHGWGIAKRIEQVSQDLLEMKYGTLYPALIKLEQHGWISIARNVRFSLRALRRSPDFAAAAILTLAIGIGANTAVFRVVNGALPNPQPQPEACPLISVQHTEPGAPGLWT